MASRIAEELDTYNFAAKEIATRLGSHWVDITEISRRRGLDEEMLADDKLHPSGAMYKLWAEQVYPVAKSVLQSH